MWLKRVLKLDQQRVLKLGQRIYWIWKFEQHVQGTGFKWWLKLPQRFDSVNGHSRVAGHYIEKICYGLNCLWEIWNLLRVLKVDQIGRCTMVARRPIESLKWTWSELFDDIWCWLCANDSQIEGKLCQTGCLNEWGLCNQCICMWSSSVFIEFSCIIQLLENFICVLNVLYCNTIVCWKHWNNFVTCIIDERIEIFEMCWEWEIASTCQWAKCILFLDYMLFVMKGYVPLCYFLCICDWMKYFLHLCNP